VLQWCINKCMASCTRTRPCILLRTIFLNPNCGDTLFLCSYPNDTWAFISVLFGLFKHPFEIGKGSIFFLGTLFWGHRTLPSCGDCVVDSTYGYKDLHTRLVGIVSWDGTYGYTWLNLTCGNYLDNAYRDKLIHPISETGSITVFWVMAMQKITLK